MKHWNRIEAAMNRHRKRSDTDNQNNLANMIELDNSSTGRIVKIKINADEVSRPMCLSMIDAAIYSVGATSMTVGDEITIICPSNEIADTLRQAWSK